VDTKGNPAFFFIDMIFNFLTKNEKAGGYIALNGLQDWWQKSFTDSERKHIREVVGGTWNPLDSDDNGELQKYNKPAPLGFLMGMAGWFNNSRDRDLAVKMIVKAEEFATPHSDPLDLHFFYAQQMKIYNAGKPDQSGLNKVIKSCHNQINLAPRAAQEFRRQYKGNLPVHEGYDKLINILQKDKKYDDAIKYMTMAKEEGWGSAKWGKGKQSTWDDQILKLTKLKDQLQK
jgi:hypothetical protein